MSRRWSPGEWAWPAALWDRSRVWTVLLLVLVAALGVLGIQLATVDGRQDTFHIVDTTNGYLQAVRWPATLLVVGFSCLHYVAAAIGARAASGVRTPLGETFLAQLSAASANRIVPAGVGGSAVLARYLTRRGGLRVSAALGAVACLAVFGAVADLLALAVLLTVGGWFGLSGGVAELATLARRLAELPHAVASSPMILALIAAVVAGVGAFAGRRLWARRPRVRRNAFWQPLRKLVRRPRALCTLMTASAGTTIVLGLAFAASAMMLPGSHPHASVGALVIGYMLAAGTAAALPIPSGVGAVETTLSAVLISAHVPAAQAIADVLAFRVITFWLPAVAGLGAARQLRRAGAL